MKHLLFILSVASAVLNVIIKEEESIEILKIFALIKNYFNYFKNVDK